MDILKAETKTAIDSITVISIKTLLDTASITLQDKKESVYSELNKQKADTILLFNKGKRL